MQHTHLLIKYTHLLSICLYRYILDSSAPSISLQRIFYPQWWLQAVGYFNNQPNRNPAANLYEPAPSLPTPAKGQNYDKGVSISVYYMSMLFTCVCTTVMVMLGMSYVNKRHSHGYQPILNTN